MTNVPHVPSSPGVKAGTLCIADTQYERLSQVARDCYVPVRGASGTRMWRYLYADTPYETRPILIDSKIDKSDVLNAWWVDALVLHNRFLEALDKPNGDVGVILIEADEDDEFTYGVFCTVLTELNLNESDWIIDRQFGNVYSIQHIDLTDNE